MAESSMKVRLTQLWVIAISKHEHFKGSVATRFRWSGILYPTPPETRRYATLWNLIIAFPEIYCYVCQWKN